MFFGKKKQRRLSAYLDGELTAKQSVNLGEQLAFDADLRSQLADLATADSLVRNTLAPAHIPTPPLIPVTEGEATQIDPLPRRRLPFAALAAAGLLATVGITLASLRRRGIV
ncbi:MAG: hypothetical protein VX792_03780 [Candidatus Latescibacterota bacterium]|nr:hypothetical protein [Candidatus Latescibacterota bacterium]